MIIRIIKNGKPLCILQIPLHNTHEWDNSVPKVVKTEHNQGKSVIRHQSTEYTNYVIEQSSNAFRITIRLFGQIQNCTAQNSAEFKLWCEKVELVIDKANALDDQKKRNRIKLLFLDNFLSSRTQLYRTIVYYHGLLDMTYRETVNYILQKN